MKKHVVIIGGGITGLSIAFALREKMRVTLFEPDELGGTIKTVRESGFLIEGGPDSFLTTKPAAVELCRHLQLEDELIPLSTRKLYVVHRGSLEELPEGFFLTVPTRVTPVLRSRLLSWPAKLRMGLDLFMPRGTEEDESLGSFVRRRFGQEVLDKIADPLMGGIYGAPANELSLKSTFPQFREMERSRRSLIRAMWKKGPSGRSPLMALRGGMSTLVDRLAAAIDARVIRERVRSVEAGYVVKYDGGSLEAEEVVVATPAPVGADLLESWPELSECIRQVRHVSSVTVSLGYRASDVERTLDATGFILPRKEGRRIHACTWSSSKFEGRSPEGSVLLRCFLRGEPSDPESISREELRELLGLEAEPQITKIFRWEQRNPVYAVGHQERVKAILDRVPAGLHLAGPGYRGTGIPNCIQEGRALGERILNAR